jgi:hypothetical protein
MSRPIVIREAHDEQCAMAISNPLEWRGGRSDGQQAVFGVE